MANDKKFKIKNGLDVGNGVFSEKSGDNRNYFRSTTSDRSYIYFQNSSTGTADTDGLLVGVNTAESALFYNQEATPMYIGSNGVVQRLTLESDGDLLVYNTDASTVVAKFNASTENVELAGDIVFEGSTADANETTVTVTDPTADRTVTIPDQTGDVMLWQNDWESDPGGSTAYNYAIGSDALGSAQSNAENNLAFGYDALTSLTSGTYNVGIGNYSLDAQTTSSYNTALGYGAATSVTTGFQNTALGMQALRDYTTGASSVGVGYRAGLGVTTGGSNVHIGYQSGGTLSTQYAVAVGYNSQLGGTGEVSIGYDAGRNNSNRDYNVNVGYSAGRGNASVDYQINIGRGAGELSTGSYAVGIGYNACRYNNQYFSVGLGTFALGSSSANGATYNVAVGGYAGNGIATGDFNTHIGYNANVYYNNSQNGVAIGAYSRHGHVQATSVGYQAGYSMSGQSDYCTLIGYQAGYDMDAGDYCTYVGASAGFSGGSGNGNNGIGYESLYNINGGAYNVGLGMRAGRQMNTGDNNTLIGSICGYNVTSGDDNTFVGRNAGYHNGSVSTYGTTTGSNNTVIGAFAVASSATVSNEITLGNASITSLRCNVQTISSLSDERDKTAIEDLPYGLDFINDMRPVQFTWNRRDGSLGAKPDMGFIAQELYDIELDHSSTSRTRLVNWENPSKLEADYLRSYPILVKAVQELSAKCDALEARIVELEGN